VLAGTRLSPRDRALAEALHARYAPGGTQNGAHADRYADMLVKLSARFPDDNLVAIMAAEAIMSAQPWDYWQAGGKIPKGRIGEALALVETVLARAPDDPQAIHLLIHLTEASAHPERAAGPAARLESIAPAAPHMVHMPSHTWYRIGRFDDAIAATVAPFRLMRPMRAALAPIPSTMDISTITAISSFRLPPRSRIAQRHWPQRRGSKKPLPPTIWHRRHGSKCG
jgi:hypothetical protein